MPKVWSMSTTVRNPYRIRDFLTVLDQLNGQPWDNDNQIRYQAMLIQNRLYTPTNTNLSDEQIEILEDPTYEMTYEEALDIFLSKNYRDPAMRGRTSFKPIEKWGLAFNIDRTLYIADMGRRLINNEIEVEDVCFRSLLKMQYPDDDSSDFTADQGYDIKPFVGTLHLIKRVNELCEQRGLNAVGISKTEFGIFALSLINFRDINQKAEDLLDFRQRLSEAEDPRAFREQFTLEYLSDFTNASLDNIKDYSDNAIRYFRLTRYIYIRGGGYYIDLEPRRMIELNLLLANDDGSSVDMDRTTYIEYMGNYNSYPLPWETDTELRRILQGIITEINDLEEYLDIPTRTVQDPAVSLQENIEILREERRRLQNLKLRRDYAEIENIREAINALVNIRNLPEKPSIALEKWTNIALNILNDAVEIKPNSPVGDDNEILFTAPANVPDIEFRYSNWAGICEVTMLTGRDQWYNEGQPVQRHLRDFEENSDLDNYCLFISPRLHRDTANTFWNAIKYEFEGRKQKIIPLNIQQLIDLLEVVLELKTNNRRFRNEYLKDLYDKIMNIDGCPSSTEWIGSIPAKIEEWKTELIA